MDGKPFLFASVIMGGECCTLTLSVTNVTQENFVNDTQSRNGEAMKHILRFIGGFLICLAIPIGLCLAVLLVLIQLCGIKGWEV